MPSKRKKAVMAKVEEVLLEDGMPFVLSPEGLLQLLVQRKNACHHCTIEYVERIDAVWCRILNYLSNCSWNSAELNLALLHAQSRVPCMRFVRDMDNDTIFAESLILLGGTLPNRKQIESSLLMLLCAADSLYPVLLRILHVPGMTAKESIGIFEAEMQRGGNAGRSEAEKAGPPINPLLSGGPMYN